MHIKLDSTDIQVLIAALRHMRNCSGANPEMEKDAIDTLEWFEYEVKSQLPELAQTLAIK